MVKTDLMRSTWVETRDRLVAKGLFGDTVATLSVRCPAAGTMWLGAVADAEPVQMLWCRSTASGMAAVHARVYACRADVGAIVWGGGPYGACLADFGNLLPQVFDEQARHIGRMAPAIEYDAELESALRTGGNAVLCGNLPLCFGTTATRLAKDERRAAEAFGRGELPMESSAY
jgi:hypothetical protein